MFYYMKRELSHACISRSIGVIVVNFIVIKGGQAAWVGQMGSYLQTSVTKVGLSEAKGGSLGAAVPGTFRLLSQEELRLLYTL